MQFANDTWGIAWAFLVTAGAAVAGYLWTAARREPWEEDSKSTIWRGMLWSVRRAGFLLLAPLLFLVLFPFVATFPRNGFPEESLPRDELVQAIAAHGKAVERLAKAEEALAGRVRPTVDCTSCGERSASGPLGGSEVVRWMVAISLFVGGLIMLLGGLFLIFTGFTAPKPAEDEQPNG